METFDDLMAKLKPGVRFAAESTLKDGGGDRLSVELDFQSMDDFSPAAVARKVPPLRKLLEARQQLSNLRSYMTGRVQAEDLLQKLLSDPALMAAIKDRRTNPPAVAGADGDGAEGGSEAGKPGGDA